VNSHITNFLIDDRENSGRIYGFLRATDCWDESVTAVIHI
jgi:hypothetical protein